MTTRLVRRALHRSLDQTRHVHLVPPREATGLVARLHDQAEGEMS